MTCEHHDFNAQCQITRLEDTGQFMLEVRVHCTQCKVPFQFAGLPAGLNLRGAAVSVDGQEARLAIAPAGTVACFLDDVRMHIGSRH